MSEGKVFRLWKPIVLADNWLACDTSIFDGVSAAWYARREVLQSSSKEYRDFMEELKREHAIETGVIERLYNLERGVTETLIRKGFIEAYVSHEATDVPVAKLFSHLIDHMEAVDFVFDVVKENRPLTVGFIHQLHALVTRNQDSAEGRDVHGNKTRVELLRGKYKERENNPTRVDGTTVLYCSPDHVASEMDNLIAIYNDAVESHVHPIILTAWVHHAFTTIHPYQDGNGRVARLLASLILIKNGLFPFTVLREEAKELYIDALELADNGEAQPLVSYLCETQRKHIEKALNLKEVSDTSSLDEVARIFSGKLENWQSEQKKEREVSLSLAREQVFNLCLTSVNATVDKLRKQLNGGAAWDVRSCAPSDASQQHFYYGQIIKYAKKHDYYFNRNFPKGWVMITIQLSPEKRYQLGISIHHYGYDDSALALGAFLEDGGNHLESAERLNATLPLEIKPLVISTAGDIAAKEGNIQKFVSQALTLTIAYMANEL